MTDLPFQQTTLPNGLRIRTAAMPQTRSVSAGIYVGAGSRYETPEEAGLAHFLEHLCFKGTEAYPTPQTISQAIDGVGGSINAATDRELTIFYCKVAQPHMALALDVLADLVRRPLLDAAELEKERKVVIEELAMVADSPNQQVELLLDETLWPDQPLGRDVAGSVDSVMGLNRDLTVNYLHRQYVPNNTVVSVAGAISHQEIVDRLQRSLGDWGRGVPTTWFPAIDGQSGVRAAAKYRSTEQSHLELAVRGLPIQHPDRYVLSLLSVILGEGMSSRLALELRENRGLCYDIHSYASYFHDAGALAIYAGVDPADAEEALAAIMAELSRLRDEPIPDDELERGKELMKGRLLLRMEDTRAVSDWMGAQELLTGRVRTVDEVTDLIDAVTNDDVQRVARDLIVQEHLNLAVVGRYRSPRRFLPILKL